VEKYQASEPWHRLDREAVREMASELSDLPNELPAENEEAKRFDLLLLRLQLGRLVPERGYERLREKAQDLAGILLEYDSIPAVREQIGLIAQVAGEEWWQDVTLPMLELARLRLRSLIGLIEKGKRRIVYSNFTDEISMGLEVELPGFALDNFARFRDKARAFLRSHLDHVAIQKLRRNRPLTATDLVELERMLLENGIGTAEEIARAKDEAHGLGLFVRSLIGLEREAVREALEGFVQGRTFTANQLEFISMLIEHLSEHGVIDAGRLYESPFIDLAPAGPEALFGDAATDALLQTIEMAARNADAA
jgi:type I restriction enzyme, R subunit